LTSAVELPILKNANNSGEVKGHPKENLFLLIWTKNEGLKIWKGSLEKKKL